MQGIFYYQKRGLNKAISMACLAVALLVTWAVNHFFGIIGVTIATFFVVIIVLAVATMPLVNKLVIKQGSYHIDGETIHLTMDKPLKLQRERITGVDFSPVQEFGLGGKSSERVWSLSLFTKEKTYQVFSAPYSPNDDVSVERLGTLKDIAKYLGAQVD